MIACAVSLDLDRHLDDVASADSAARFDEERVQEIAGKLEDDLIANVDTSDLAKLAADFMHHHDGAHYLAEAMKANDPALFGAAAIAHVREVLAARAERNHAIALDRAALLGDDE